MELIFFPFLCAHRRAIYTIIFFPQWRDSERVNWKVKGLEVWKLDFCVTWKTFSFHLFISAFYHAACYLSLWFLFLFSIWIESVSLLAHHPLGWKFLIELIVKWILIPFLILFMTLFGSVTFSTSIKKNCPRALQQSHFLCKTRNV